LPFRCTSFSLYISERKRELQGGRRGLWRGGSPQEWEKRSGGRGKEREFGKKKKKNWVGPNELRKQPSQSEKTREKKNESHGSTLGEAIGQRKGLWAGGEREWNYFGEIQKRPTL